MIDNAWYVDFGNGTNTGYYSVAQFAINHVYTAGTVIRQLATPTVGNERCFVCIIAGTSAGSEPAWTVTRGAKTVSNTATFQECTGIAALNGDSSTNTPNWTTVKNQAISLGQVIQRNNGASYQICSTAGTSGNGSEPAFSDTAGTTTADNTATWTSLGAVGNYTGWQYPHARLANAFASGWGQAGNKFFVASEHAETQTTAITLTDPGTPAASCYVLCTAKTPIPPTSCTTGAIITSSAASLVRGTGSAYWQGIEFKVSSTGNVVSLGNSNNRAYYKNCKLTKTDTGTGGFAFMNLTGGVFDITLDGCTITFGSNTAQTINNTVGSGSFKMLGGSFVFGANIPTTLLGTMSGLNIFDGVDFTGITSGKTVLANQAIGRTADTLFKNCKYTSGATMIAAQTSSYRSRATLINTDTGAANYRAEAYDFAGALTTETTIVRTGGATDGTTPISHKIVTTSGASQAAPFRGIPIRIWNDTTAGNVTVTIYGIWGGGAVPNNDDIWLEISYMGNSGDLLDTLLSGAKSDPLTSNSAWSSDSSSWGGSTTPFKITATIAPRIKGYITIVPVVAATGTTIYVDPKPFLSDSPAVSRSSFGENELFAGISRARVGQGL